jgi:hypothetical protein
VAVDPSDNREQTFYIGETHATTRHGVVSKLFMSAIRLYQVTLSRAFPPSCRFYPSCSEYTRQAIAKYGAMKGSWMGVKRILRCHPFHPGGYDPVP